MKQFDYNSYMRNNPLLKEDLESDIRKDLEGVSGIKLNKSTEVPEFADSDIKKELETGEIQRITQKTKLKVNDRVINMANNVGAYIVSISGNDYKLTFDFDEPNKRPTKKSRIELEKYFALES